MLKFIAKLENGDNLYGFGLSESNLNRLQFNDEPIFFDFEYAGHPELFGLFIYFDEFQTPEEAASNLDVVKERCIPFIDESQGISGETLRFFPIVKSVMQKFRDTPFWGFDAKIKITNPNDQQLIFSGRTEQEMRQYLGLIKPFGG